jgi:isopenicillin N synthase-like dioxygenase
VADATIPVISLHDLAPSSRKPEAVQALGEALETFGFVAITEHDVGEALLADAYGQARELFALPASTKQRYEDASTGRQRGYTSVGVEHAKNQPVPDLKEFWHVGRREGDVVPNVEPGEVPAFAPTFNRLFDELDRVATTLLTSVGSYLGKPEGFFEDFTRGGNSVLRVIHYPPVEGDVEPGAVRAAAHEDINLITVLPVATEPGLQLMTRDGEWIDVQTPPNVMVCDTGDMMQLHTGGRLRSTTHRVVNPRGEDTKRSRYSMPFFCHPRGDALLQASPEVRAEAFLMERLRDIGVA